MHVCKYKSFTEFLILHREQQKYAHISILQSLRPPIILLLSVFETKFRTHNDWSALNFSAFRMANQQFTTFKLQWWGWPSRSSCCFNVLWPGVRPLSGLGRISTPISVVLTDYATRIMETKLHKRQLKMGKLSVRHLKKSHSTPAGLRFETTHSSRLIFTHASPIRWFACFKGTFILNSSYGDKFRIRTGPCLATFPWRYTLHISILLNQEHLIVKH